MYNLKEHSTTTMFPMRKDVQSNLDWKYKKKSVNIVDL
jgi:hypothetical protein